MYITIKQGFNEVTIPTDGVELFRAICANLSASDTPKNDLANALTDTNGEDKTTVTLVYESER